MKHFGESKTKNEKPTDKHSLLEALCLPEVLAWAGALLAAVLHKEAHQLREVEGVVEQEEAEGNKIAIFGFTLSVCCERRNCCLLWSSLSRRSDVKRTLQVCLIPICARLQKRVKCTLSLNEV